MGRDDEEFICGRQPVREYLREGLVRKVFIYRNARGVSDIIELARTQRIRYVFVDKNFFEGRGLERHQGVAAKVLRYEYSDISTLMDSESENYVVIMADRVTDPRNLGAVIRSAVASGIVRGLILPKVGSAEITPTVVKSSAGAVHKLPIAKVGSMRSTALLFKENGFELLALDRARADVKLWDYKPSSGRLLLMVGGETGLRTTLIKLADHVLEIPITGVESLNLSVATALAVFHIARLWRERKEDVRDYQM